MKMRIVGAIVFVTCFSTTMADGGQPARRANRRPANRPPASRPAQPSDDPNLPRVLLIGDSISIGYTAPTKKLLAGEVNLHRIPANGGPTIRGLEQLESWLGTGHWDVIHFNWGLHDLKYMEDGKHQVPIDQYEANLNKLVRRLERTGAKLIWAATTPVPNGKVNPPRKNEDVIAYNAVARRIMDGHHIAVNDLYTFALPRLAEIQRPVNVHFTEDGSAALARRVAASIRTALRTGSRAPQTAPASRPAAKHEPAAPGK